MGPTRTPFAVLLALVAALHHAVSRNYDFVFDRAAGEFNGEFYAPRTSFTVTEQNNTTGITCLIDIHKALPNDSMLDLALLERHDKMYIQSFVKYRSNYCDYLSKEKKPVVSDFKRILDFPPTCPLKGVFKMSHWRGGDLLLPPIWPGPDEWKLNIMITSGTTVLQRNSILFHVDRHKGARG